MLLRGQIALLKQPGKAADGHDGRLELVRKIIDKIVPENLGAVQLARHVVEAALECAQIRSRVCRFRQPDLEIPLRDFLRRADELFKGAVYLFGQDNRQKASCQKAKRKAQRDGKDRCVHLARQDRIEQPVQQNREQRCRNHNGGKKQDNPVAEGADVAVAARLSRCHGRLPAPPATHFRYTPL